MTNAEQLVPRLKSRRLLETVLTFGLHMKTSDLSLQEIAYQEKHCQDILTRCTLEQAIEAARYGMPTVWPFSEDNRPWDARDLNRNLLKARAGAHAAWERGDIPFDAQKAK